MSNEEEPTGADRVAFAIVLGVLGFFTGLIAVWTFSDLPGVRFGKTVYLGVAAVTGLACLALGYRSSASTIDALGEVWNVLWKLSLGIINFIRSLSR